MIKYSIINYILNNFSSLNIGFLTNNSLPLIVGERKSWRAENADHWRIPRITTKNWCKTQWNRQVTYDNEFVYKDYVYVFFNWKSL